MECVRDRGEIAAFVDGELEGAARTELESHLETCAGCRELVAAQRKLGEMFAALPALTPSADFEARFWARIARESEAAHGGFGAGLRRLLAPRRMLALAAVGVFVLALAIFLPRMPWGPKAKPDVDVRIVTNANDFELIQDPDMDAISEVDVLEDWDDASPG